MDFMILFMTNQVKFLGSFYMTFDKAKVLMSNLKKVSKITNHVHHPGNVQQNVSLALDILDDTTVGAIIIFNQIIYF